MKPLLEEQSVLKVVQNLKYDIVVMHRHGIEIAPYDDTMLISYVLEAGKAAHMAWTRFGSVGWATRRSDIKN